MSEGDLDEARHWLSRIVGRDTKNLPHSEIVRAAVETTAESTGDGIISVLFYSFIGGPIAAMVFKAVSTLDSMVGYNNERYREFGCVSAKMDDMANFIPARLSALLIGLAVLLFKKSPWQVWTVVVRDAAKQLSPNSGYPESAFAGALGVQLGGDNYYGGKLVKKETMGDPNEELGIQKITQALKLMYATTAVGLIFCILMYWFVGSFFNPQAYALEERIEILSKEDTKSRLDQIVCIPYRLEKEGTLTKQKRTSLRKTGEVVKKLYRPVYVDVNQVNDSKKPLKVDGYAGEEILIQLAHENAMKQILQDRCNALNMLALRADPSCRWAIKFYDDAFTSLIKGELGKFRRLYRDAQERSPN